MALNIYNALRPLSGKRGYEMRRFGGSSGPTCHESDRNLLRVLSENKGALPRKTWATVILRGPDRYYDIYQKCNSEDSQSSFTHVEYSPPKDGGQFSMPEVCIERYPVLGEMSYLKMQSVYILIALNQFREDRGQSPVAVGPMKKEIKNIALARKSYNTSTTPMRMHNFIHTFNTLNHYSMVAYTAGMHEDNFRDGESLENKILLTLPTPKCGSIGRGGSIVGNRFVYALLDW